MNSSAHTSAFSYNLTRPYPFRWFTPVVVVGCIALAAIFSLLNYISAGFSPINVVTDNPHGTIAGSGWFEKWPSMLTEKA